VAKGDLWRYFQEIRAAVEAANRGDGSQPYESGNFMVSALSKDVELTISDISEEDAILIASELHEQGVKALVRASTVCPHCGRKVPKQSYCTSCRGKLGTGK
jgi:hypothetical protein